MIATVAAQNCCIMASSQTSELLNAVAKNDQELCLLLLSQGADVNGKDAVSERLYGYECLSL